MGPAVHLDHRGRILDQARIRQAASVLHGKCDVIDTFHRQRLLDQVIEIERKDVPAG